MTVAFHPGGKILASGGASTSSPPAGPDYPDDHSVRLWDLAGQLGNLIREFFGVGRLRNP
jgi:hypothetical protein